MQFLIHKWLKDERCAPEPEADESALFLPLKIDGGLRNNDYSAAQP